MILTVCALEVSQETTVFSSSRRNESYTLHFVHCNSRDYQLTSFHWIKANSGLSYSLLHKVVVTNATKLTKINKNVLIVSKDFQLNVVFKFHPRSLISQGTTTTNLSVSNSVISQLNRIVLFFPSPHTHKQVNSEDEFTTFQKHFRTTHPCSYFHLHFLSWGV